MNIPKSLEMQKRAQRLIPGMTQLLSKRPDMFAPGIWPGYFSRAKGVQVWDLDGNCYVDMSISGIGANVLGYGDPDVDKAVLSAIDAGISSSLNCPEEVELAELLCSLHPWADMVRYARSGGESMAIAVRIARAHTDKDIVAFCGYHGWHDWYLSTNLGTENALGEHLLPGLNPKGVPRGLRGTSFPFRYNHIEELQAIVQEYRHQLAAIIMEPIRSEQPKPGFFEAIRALADETGTVLIIDEISSGFRLNTGGAHLLFNVLPDIAVFSKALGNGYPIAAIIGKREIMEAAQNTFISSTMWTERTGPTAAIATIKKHRRHDVGKHLVSIGKKIQEGWARLAQKNGLEISIGGIPPLSHFAFAYDNAPAIKALFVQLMLEQGFLASTLFYSMYAHQEEHVDKYLQAVDSVFLEISKAIRTGSVEKQMKGKPASVGFKRLT
jgi:glutamate-1-semialdehyde 2,1-aminomutase